MIGGTRDQGQGVGFFRAEAGRNREALVPGPAARSGWGGAGQIRGAAVSGVLARASESAAQELDDAHRFRPVRWTLDLFHPAAMAPVGTRSTVVRRGRRLRLIDTELVQDGAVVARASALLLATDGRPAEGTVWNPGPGTRPAWPDPGLRPGTSEQTLFHSDGLGWTGVPAPHQNRARKMLWHLPEPVVEGEAPSPFQRLAAVADSSNLAGNWGDRGVEFINADITLAITRLPAADSGIGIVAEDRGADPGIAVTRTTLHDRTGPLGTVLLSALANTAAAVDLRSGA